jgi:iron complex outermembrane recepter protein
VLATDYIVAPGVRDARVLQNGLNLTYQINDSTTLELDLARSKSWNKYDYGAGYLVVGTRNIGRTPHWINPGDGGFPYYNYDELTSSNDPSNLYSHCCNIGGNHLTNRLDEYKLNLSKSFLDGVLARLDFGVMSSSHSNRSINMGQDDAMSLCAFYCGYNSTAPAEAIGAYLFDAGGWFGNYSHGFPSQWVSYDPHKYLAWLTSPESYMQLAGLKSEEDLAAFIAALADRVGVDHARQRDPPPAAPVNEPVAGRPSAM